ncbi:MAG TPA: MarR family transcriptional regulator [Acetivibrio sp.]|nr:MarR family transcriptional regulator [Acetivibrio sp.]
MDYTEILNYFIDNIKKLFYPEEWLNLDLSFSKSEIFVILVVDRQGEITMSKIADYINSPMSTATGIVDRLVKKGYLKRERSESDRRVVAIKLTDEGKSLIDEFKKTAFKYIKLIYDSLTDEERVLVMKIFTRIVDIISSNESAEDSEDEDQNKLKKIDIE